MGNRKVNELHLAAAGGHHEIIELLLADEKFVPDPDVKDSKGQTVLHYAAAEGRVGVLEWFLRHTKVDINATNAAGYTPLHIATKKGMDSSVKALLSRNPNIRAKTIDDRTALELAVEVGLIVPIERLIWKGATITLQGSLANTISRWEMLTQNKPEALKDDDACEIEVEIADDTPISLTQLQHMRAHFPSDPVLKLLQVRACIDSDKLAEKLEVASSLFEEGSDWEIEGDRQLSDNLRHPYNQCDGLQCHMWPIQGYRYKCTVCADIDYCQTCYEKNKKGGDEHLFLQIPSATRFQSLKRSDSKT